MNNEIPLESIETYIAIDMGTSGTGVSYCTKDTKTINEVKLWSSIDGIFQYKNQSAILYRESEPISWGTKAVDSYKRIRRKEEKKNPNVKFFLIRNFKLNIYNKKVVSDFLRLVSQDINKELKKQNIITKRRHVKYAVTVPAIWSDSDKALMRRAAKRAGILSDEYDDSNHFILALEPESAALPCLLYKNVKILEGVKFLIFDAGGGTVDLAVYEASEGSNENQFLIKQLRRASGGTCGGKAINDAFLSYMEKILGGSMYSKLINMACSNEMFSNVEKFKKGYNQEEIDDDDEFFIPLPTPMSKLLEKEGVDSKYFDEDEGEFIVSGKIMKRIYDKIVKESISYIRTILSNVIDVKYVFMVGGFSDSNYLYNKINTEFSKTGALQVIKPSQPGIRVLQGACWFAKNPQIIVSRCSPLTYGVNVTDKYDRELHYDKSNILKIKGEKYSKNLFKVMMKQGEIVEVGTRVKIGVKAINDVKASFEIFASVSEKTPIYVSEESCNKLISITIPLTKAGQAFDVTTIFGETELKCEIVDSETNEKLIHTAIFEFTEDTRLNDSKVKFNETESSSFSQERSKGSDKRSFFYDETEKVVKQNKKLPPPIPSRKKTGRPKFENRIKNANKHGRSTSMNRNIPKKNIPAKVVNSSHGRTLSNVPVKRTAKSPNSPRNKFAKGEKKNRKKNRKGKNKRQKPPTLPKAGEVKRHVIKKSKFVDDPENYDLEKMFDDEDVYLADYQFDKEEYTKRNSEEFEDYYPEE